MKKGLKLMAAALSGLAIMSAASLTGCKKGGDAHTYDMWLYTAQDTAYYKDYADNPVLKYLLKEQYGGETIKFEFKVPAAGSAQDNYQTMINSGDFPTVMQSSVADPAPIMYQNGLILDITDYVKEYMPNYSKLLEENAELKAQSVFNVDGKERILSLNVLNESSPYVDFGGMCYRRDWIVKYGKNPSTGAAFTGGYTNANDIDAWTDDVVFPSWYNAEKKEKALVINPEWDGTSPFYISDWEWMFEIFEKAMQSLGISDGYCTSMYYPGYTWAGGLCSCFGEGGIVWYADGENKVKFGGSSDSIRAYFNCLNTWCKKGWLDNAFNERVRDAYYQIDSTSVRQGKVGMWCGVKGDLGGKIDLTRNGTSDDKAYYTKGIFVAGCPYPVNDVYGGDDCKYIAPRVMNVDTSLVGTGYFVMKGAEKKDLGPMFAFFDRLYSKEGAAMRTLGLSKGQLDEPDTDKSFYEKYGLTDGAYFVGVSGKYLVSEVISNDSGALSAAANLDKLPGIQLVSSIDYGYAETLENSLKSWIAYKNTGRIWGSTAMLNMSVEDGETAQKALTKVLDYMQGAAFKFIKGDKDVSSESVWRSWKNDLAKFNVDSVSSVLQKYVNLYPVN